MTEMRIAKPSIHPCFPSSSSIFGPSRTISHQKSETLFLCCMTTNAKFQVHSIRSGGKYIQAWKLCVNSTILSSKTLSYDKAVSSSNWMSHKFSSQQTKESQFFSRVFMHKINSSVFWTHKILNKSRYKKTFISLCCNMNEQNFSPLHLQECLNPQFMYTYTTLSFSFCIYKTFNIWHLFLT